MLGLELGEKEEEGRGWTKPGKGGIWGWSRSAF